jgi:nitrogen regulatory protein PII
MKMIEAVIDPSTLEALRTYLARAGIDGRLTITKVNSIENLGPCRELGKTNQNQWKPSLRVDLVVSDRQTQAAVNIILQHANLARSVGSGGQINILSLDAVLGIGSEAPALLSS